MILYKYHCRPSFFSDKLLIEIFSGTSGGELLTDFLFAASIIHPKVIDRHDDLFHEGYSYDIETDLGKINLERDIWGFVFISANDNNLCIEKIDEQLQRNNLFEKVYVDFEKYKNPPERGERPSR